MRKRGRRTLLTPDVQERILEAIRGGAFAWVAAQAAGISPSTFHEWIARGEGSDPDRPCTPAYAEFAAQVRAAEAQARIEAEIAVKRDRPLEWLRCGPGRSAPGHPGWTNMGERTTADTESVLQYPFHEPRG